MNHTKAITQFKKLNIDFNIGLKLLKKANRKYAHAEILRQRVELVMLFSNMRFVFGDRVDLQNEISLNISEGNKLKSEAFLLFKKSNDVLKEVSK